MSFSINVGEIKASIFPAEVTKTPKPDPGEEYEATDAGTLLCVLNGRSFTKIFDGMAYVAWWISHTVTIGVDYYWGGPLLVSKTDDAVSYGTDAHREDAAGTIVFQNETWYFSSDKWFMANANTSTGGVAQYIGTFDSTEDAARYLLGLVFGS